MALLRSLSSQRTALSLVYGRNSSKSSNSVAVAACRSYHQRGNRSSTACGEAASESTSGVNGARYLHSGNRPSQASTLVQPDLVAGEAVKRSAKQSSSQEPVGGSPQRDPLDVTFNDPIAAFKSKTTGELMRAYLVYMICSSEKLVEHNMTVSWPVSPEFLLLPSPASFDPLIGPICRLAELSLWFRLLKNQGDISSRGLRILNPCLIIGNISKRYSDFRTINNGKIICEYYVPALKPTSFSTPDKWITNHLRLLSSELYGWKFG